MFSLNEIRSHFNLPDYSRDCQITGISIDSRKCQPGHLFVAICGLRVDGHDYVGDAISRGAVACLVARKPQVGDDQISIIEVADTVKGLGELACYFRSKLNLLTIAITGSCGKTTLKELVYAMLVHCYTKDSCFATPGNYNSDIGVPLSLLRMSEAHRFAVLELGMNRFNEIKTTVSYVKPHVVAINNVAPCHTEYLGDLRGVAQAKGEIIQGLDPKGVAVLNKDSEFFGYWQKLLTSDQSLLSFGMNKVADIRVLSVDTNFNGCRFTLDMAGCKQTVCLPLLGRHNAMNAACAAAIGYALNISPGDISRGLETVATVPRRLKPLLGKKNALLLDDSYNANPRAVYAAIDVLKQHSGCKILVLGDMRELGSLAIQYHRDVGYYAKQQGIDYIFAIGILTGWTVKCFGRQGYFFQKRQQLLSKLWPLLTDDCCVLIKGSLSMNMAELVEQLS